MCDFVIFTVLNGGDPKAKSTTSHEPRKINLSRAKQINNLSQAKKNQLTSRQNSTTFARQNQRTSRQLNDIHKSQARSYRDEQYLEKQTFQIKINRKEQLFKD